MICAAERIPPTHYCKGNYFSLSGRSPFSRLVYPAPEAAGLGVHLTLDLAGQARFGPDVEWIERIDYDVDPKRAEVFYKKPGLTEQIIGAPDNQSQILPEETLVGRLQSGQLDVGFFYSTETSAAKIPAIKLPDEIVPKARYTLTILRDAPSPDGAERFVSFILGPQGRELLKQYGLELLKPELSGNVQAVPPPVRSLVGAAQ